MPIPCPHFKITIVKRSQGQSAVAGAAYQSGERLFSEYDQKTKFYNKKKELVHAEIMLPSHAPPGYADRATLWNAVEAVENQWNSQLARRIVLAFPVEVQKEQYLSMIKEFCLEQFVSKGMIADFAIHDKGDGNPHAHILLTLRAMDEHGKWLPKARKVYDLDENGERIRLPSGNWKCHKENTVDWNDQKYAEVWRHSWETITNRYLEAAGRPERVDLRSFERQGIQQIPTVHLGPAAHQMQHGHMDDFVRSQIESEIAVAKAEQQTALDPAAEPVVTILFTESPHLEMGQQMPLHEADALFARLDAEHRGGGYYDKTDFRIDFTFQGEPHSYSGRQDFGDRDGSLIEHIREYQTFYLNDEKWKDHLTRQGGPEAWAEDHASREAFLTEIIPYMELHCNLSRLEQEAQTRLASSDTLTPEETAYYGALVDYAMECRPLLNHGEPLPEMPKLTDFDQSLQDYKAQVEAEIAQEAADAGMTVEEYAAAGYEAPAQPQEVKEPPQQEAPEQQTKEPAASDYYYSINEGAARRAKEMNSFSDYKPGSATAEYRHYVDKAFALAQEQKKRVDPMYHEKIDSLLDTYARKLAANMNHGYEIDARVPSILIAGGSNFPVRQKEKQNAARDSNMQEWQYIQGLLDKIRSTGMGGIRQDDPQAIPKLQKMKLPRFV